MAKAFEYTVHFERYEYDEDYHAPDDELNKYGADGWELVSTKIIPSWRELGVVYEIWYFKRETSSQ